MRTILLTAVLLGGFFVSPAWGQVETWPMYFKSSCASSKGFSGLAEAANAKPVRTMIDDKQDTWVIWKTRDGQWWLTLIDKGGKAVCVVAQNDAKDLS